MKPSAEKGRAQPLDLSFPPRGLMLDSARMATDPFTDIVLLCENLLLPFKRMLSGYQVHVYRVKSDFGYIIGSCYRLTTLKQHLA